MDSILTNAELCQAQADLVQALALKERDPTKQRLMFAVAEQYYLLHDQLVALEEAWPAWQAGAREINQQAN